MLWSTGTDSRIESKQKAITVARSMQSYAGAQDTRATNTSGASHEQNTPNGRE